MKLKLFIVSFFLITLPTIFLVPSATAAFRYLHEGMKVPEVSGQDILTGESVSSEQLRSDSNILIIVFWATWSDRSIEELKTLKEISELHADKPFKIIAINVDQVSMSETNMINAKKILSELALPFPSIIDKDYEFFSNFGVIAVPSTAITDPTGTMKFGPAGYSLKTKDLILDSLLVLLGLKEETADTSLNKGYAPEKKSSRFYNLAVNLRLQGMYSRALANLEEAQLADSLFPSVYNLKGEIYLKLNKPNEALAEFEKAITLDSELVAANAGYGHALMLTNQTDQAINALLNLLQKDDTYTPAILSLCDCYIIKKTYPDALQLIESAIELMPNDPSILHKKGKIHHLNSEYSDALINYKKALDIIFKSE